MRVRIETGAGKSPLPVMGREVPHAELMARKICNALSASFVMERRHLREAACAEVLVDRRKGSPRSVGHWPDAGTFEDGLSYALVKGWVFEREGRIHLTPTGADVAYRLRIGRRR
jgi:hypothetical protein